MLNFFDEKPKNWLHLQEEHYESVKQWKKNSFYDIEIKLKRSEKKRNCRKIDYKTLLVMVSKQSLIPRQITVFKN